MADTETLHDDDKPLNIPDRCTLGVIWTEEMYDAYYDEQKEKVC